MTKTKTATSGKKKKSNLSNAILLKKSKMKAEKKLNPFELRFAKAKYNVINRPTQSEAGKPGISRAKAIKKRKDTLLQEYKLKDKTNMFMDRRIGELDSKLSAEDKMIARFTAERMKNHGKKSIFNLGGEEALTHFGKSLADVERLGDDPRSDDEDEGDDAKRLSADYVSEAHFGGFLTRSDLEFADGKSNSRKDWIDNMIAESKKKKADRQKDHEDTVNMTVDLDSKWKAMIPTLKSGGVIYTKKEEIVLDKDEEEDSYNVLMRELAFEAKKGKAQERLKTDEELIAEEKDRLEKLEADRIRRMNGDFDPTIDGGDDEDVQESDEQEQVPIKVGAKNGTESDEDDEGEDEESEEDESAEDESGDDDDDAYSDLEEDSDNEDSKKDSKKKAPRHNIDPDAKRQKMAEAEKQIPFTFKVPASYEELSTHFENRSPADKATILERIIKCNHPQFGDDNKAKLETLFTFVLQHIHDCASEDNLSDLEEGLVTIQNLTPYLFDMAKFFPQSAAKSIVSVLQEKYEDYSKNPKFYPTMETVIFLKLVILLFPSSDYRHPVVTPALQFMSEVLANARPNSRASLSAGLALATLMVESITLSKRFSPEVLNFLVGIVFLATPKDEKTVIPIPPPFKVVGKESTLLCDTLSNKKRVSPTKIKISEMNMEGSELDAAFSATCLSTSLNLLTKLSDLWQASPSAWQIFQFLSEKLLPLLPLKKFDKSVGQLVDSLKEKLSTLKAESQARKGSELLPKKPITMLKMHEPEFENDFDPFQRKRSGPRDLRDKEKLVHKMKREKKSAKKELRKDTTFLAKQKSKEIRERDMDRQTKTKSILGGLGVQEGEFKKFEAKKKKKF